MPDIKYQFGMRKLIAWVPLTDTALAAAITGAGVLTATVASGADGAFDAASVAQYFRILIDNEIIWVTAANGVNLTALLRGKDGTTAAAHSNAAPIKVLQPIRLWQTSDFAMAADDQVIEFAGDGGVHRVHQLQAVDGTFTLTAFNADLLEKVAKSTAATTGLRTDETRRWNPEIGTYPYVELWVDRRAENGNDGSDETVRTIIWKAKLQKPFIMGDAGNNAAETSVVNWTSVGTTQDLWGLPIIGSGNAAITEEIHFSYSEVA